ncbi:MAG: serine/threonine-protein kinase, partial [Candidatus Acidiferrales bacterium]
MQQIGRYEILFELGRGAMGAVYQARDPQIDRIVAIKVILTHGLSDQELEGFKQRFYREARAAGKMSHPGIVTIHDIAEDENGRPYLVMEFVEGSNLEDIAAQRLANGEKLPLWQALDIAIQVANALDYAHKRGVVHRDVKPANILVTHDGVAKVADFGIAKVSGIAITQTGGFLGTPAFMSPEQFSGGDIDARSDLFSLGAMLYWMFTGAQPFSGETLTTVSFRIVFTYPVPANQVNAELPPEIHT